jgi:hypothetical protein
MLVGPYFGPDGLEVEDSLCWAVFVKKIVLSWNEGRDEAGMRMEWVGDGGPDVLWNCLGAGAEDDHGGGYGRGLYDDSGGGECGAG